MRLELQRCRLMVEKRLDDFFTERKSYAGLLESMRYSLLAGGKRIRAVVCLKFCEAAGGRVEEALDAACAIEMLHAYTLIHDDLPCMDNDDMRRGKPSNHIRFGEFTATLAGDALQAAAFDTILGSKLPPGTVVRMGRLLAQAAGPYGMCAGQYLDMQEKRLETEGLAVVHGLKTAALISAAARIGVLAAGGSDEQIKAAEDYANAAGLAFQVRDDVLDYTATTEEIGKPTGSDRANDKTTFAALMGLDECEEVIRKETEKAILAVNCKFGNADFLVWLARMLAERRN